MRKCKKSVHTCEKADAMYACGKVNALRYPRQYAPERDAA
ncbi:hypothetical protein CIT292_07265 [Citrobacter youngae ATCC 29220]|uniref:Uncharacterized protein n=1 Tax=Citrobacter youngae ATCC 29220 TaxID=500640 RepID=D4B9X5_9ENTR|nr:hypothetical protein CIT292_07265 [Citrobacter youngae ATCC 29220]